jgi:hypothetical protein
VLELVLFPAPLSFGNSCEALRPQLGRAVSLTLLMTIGVVVGVNSTSRSFGVALEIGFKFLT